MFLQIAPLHKFIANSKVSVQRFSLKSTCIYLGGPRHEEYCHTRPRRVEILYSIRRVPLEESIASIDVHRVLFKLLAFVRVSPVSYGYTRGRWNVLSGELLFLPSFSPHTELQIARHVTDCSPRCVNRQASQ